MSPRSKPLRLMSSDRTSLPSTSSAKVTSSSSSFSTSTANPSDWSSLTSTLNDSGTHTGPFLGLEPTGRRVRVGAFEAWRVQDGRCTEHWLQLDTGDLLRQLG